MTDTPPPAPATRALAGMVGVVTGAGSGIGQGIALAVARAGAAVVVNDLTAERAASTVNLIESAGGRAVVCVGDVTERGSAEAMLASALRTFGRCDALVNNAGILSKGAFVDLTEDDWDRVMRVNTRSVFVCTQTFARHWIAHGEPGRVVNIASIHAEFASTAGTAHYAASKGAVRMLTKVTAAELATHGITVNAIGPGGIFTGIHTGDQVPASESARLGARLASVVPVGRAGTPDDIAAMAVHMCSPASSFMTGQLVLIDGGRSL